MNTVRLIQAALGGNKTPTMASSEASQVDVLRTPLSTHRPGKIETGFSEIQLHIQKPIKLQKPFPTLQTQSFIQVLYIQEGRNIRQKEMHTEIRG